MAWIKRNLLFVIGAVIAVGLLAAAGVYDYQNWQHNEAALDRLHQTYNALRRLNNQNPSPGNDEVDNIKTARKQEQQLRRWIQQAGKYFQPISPIPNPANGVITDAQFAAARDHTLNQLQIEASDASVTLPDQYSFSFDAERTLVRFEPGSLNALAQQLGEVKTICGILYGTRINSLDNIRRVRISSDDARGPQSDYLNQRATTNALAILTPYEVTFRCFSQNLASVLSSFASSPHGFIVTGINVQPASGVPAASSPSAAPMPDQPAYASPSYANLQRPGFVPTPSRSSSGLQTVLNEQLLSITLQVEIIKLLPGNK